MANINLTPGERYTFGKLKGISVITDSSDYAQTPKYIRNTLIITASGASIIQINDYGTGDPYLRLSKGVSTEDNWSVGIDNSDGGSFKINNSGVLSVGASMALRIDTDENILMPGDVGISGSFALGGIANAATAYGLYYNTTTKQVTYGASGSGGGGSTSPGGSDTQIQYNSAGVFGGVPTLTWDGTTLRATGSFTGSLIGALTGIATSGSSISITNTPASAGTYYPVFVNGVTGYRSALVDNSTFTYDTTTNTLTVTASYATTASYVLNTVSASYAANGGVTQLLAGPNITLSPTNGLGQVTVSATLSGSTIFNTATGSYGSFYDTTTQTNPVADVPRSMSFNSTDITNGVSISGSTNPFNTYIKTQNAGIYNIQFSAQLDKTDSGTDEVVIWLRKNGIDLTDSATTLTLSGNNDKQVAAWNWFVTSATGDYYQIIWRSLDTDLRLLAEPISGTHPGIPSVILTVNRVDQFLSNTGSFSGSFTGAFTGSFSGSGTITSASYAATASLAPLYLPLAGGTISGNVTVLGTASINTLIVNQIGYSSGSNQLGDAANDTQTLYGTVRIPTGSLTVTGSTRMTGSLNVAGQVSSNDTFVSTAIYPIAQGFATSGSLTGGVGFHTNIWRSTYTGATYSYVSNAYTSSVTNNALAITRPSTPTFAQFTLYVKSDNTSVIDLGGGGPILDIANNGTPYSRFDGTNFSVGTTSALARVHVKGTGATSATTALRVENTNASASLAVLDNGYVGIGTSSPSNSLTIKTGVNDDGILLESSAGNPLFLVRKDGTSNNTAELFQYGSGAIRLAIRSITNFSYFNGGNFGFGTTTDVGYRLTISGSSTSGSLNVNNTLYVSGSSVGIGTLNPLASLHISGASSTNLLRIDSPASSSIVYVSGNGNVGIGTNSPAYRLDVAGAAYFASPVHIGSVLPALSTAAGTLYFAGSKMAIFNTGNVIIQNGGTFTDAGYRLDVQGTTRINGNTNITGSLTVTGGITGSLLGTASYATTAFTANSSNLSLSASYASNATSASIAATASYYPNAITPSGGEGTVQFQNGSGIAGNTRFTYDNSNNIVNINNGARLNATGSLQGTASVAISALTTRTNTSATFYPVFVDSANGAAAAETLWTPTSNITMNPGVGSISATSITSSIFGTASYATVAQTLLGSVTSASFSATASYVNILNQHVIVTGSMVIGSSSLGPFENTLTLGARDAVNEGGQIGFNAPGGTYTSASFIDNWQNKARILKGNNTTSTGLIAQWDIHTTQMQLPGYTAASSFPGTAAANLAVDSGGNVITVSTTGGTVFPYTGNAVITGSLTTTGIIYAQPNGGMYFQGGDDAALYDINISNHMGIYGVQDATVGSIKLGSGGGIISGKSGNIGIGTINPTSASFHVNGNVWATSFTGSFSGSVAAPGSTTQVVFNNGGVLGANSGFVYSGSNVGIGSISPQSGFRLDVNGQSVLRGAIYTNGPLIDYGTSNFRLETAGASWLSLSGTLSVGATSSLSAKLGVRGSGATSATTALRVENTNASASFVVRDDRRVGINTSTPGATLEVNGNMIITGSIDLRNSGGIRLYDSNGYGGGTIVGSYGYAAGEIYIQPLNGNGSNFIFSPTNGMSIGGFTIGGTTGSPPAYGLAVSGSIGIGTRVPITQLDVSGSGRFTGNLTVTGSVIATSFTGSLQGTASYAVQALSASWAPGGGASFPYTGSAQITGSLNVTGSFIAGDYGIVSIDSSNRITVDGSGMTSIDYGTRTLTDSAGPTTLNWDASANGYAVEVPRLYFKSTPNTSAQENFSAGVFNAEGRILQGVSFNGASDYDFVYLDNVAGEWRPVDNVSNRASKMLGIAFEVGGSDSVLLEGHVTITNTPGTYNTPAVDVIAHGLPIYVSSSAFATTTPPISTGEYVRILGHAYYQNSGDPDVWVMNFRPDHTWVEL